MNTYRIEFEFRLPSFALCAMVNGDYSGLSDAEIAAIDELMEEGAALCKKKKGRHFLFTCDEYETYFSPFNDLPGFNNIGCDVVDSKLVIFA